MLKEVLESLCQHQTISRGQAKNVLLGIAQGEWDPLLVSSFLTVFRMRNVTVDELLGFRDAMLELAIRPNLPEGETIDLCGTGGDGKDTFNISTLAAFVVAGAGLKVTKHGNVGVSSRCGSSDVLQELGVTFTNDEGVLSRQLQEAGICYLHAPLFHPAMKEVAPIRKALGARTFFNLLGPLVNPARPNVQLIGVFSLEIARLFHYLLASGEQRYVVIHALDGYDEVSLTGKWRVFGRSIDRVLAPEDLGFSPVTHESLQGGDSRVDSAQIFMNVLNGKATPEQRAVVLSNAAHAIQIGKNLQDLGEALSIAAESLDCGAARKCFHTFITIGGQYIEGR